MKHTLTKERCPHCNSFLERMGRGDYWCDCGARYMKMHGMLMEMEERLFHQTYDSVFDSENHNACRGEESIFCDRCGQETTFVWVPTWWRFLPREARHRMEFEHQYWYLKTIRGLVQNSKTHKWSLMR